MKIGVDGSVFTTNLTGIGYYSYNLLTNLANKMPDVEFIILTNKPLVVKFEHNNIQIIMDNNPFLNIGYIWKLFTPGLLVKKYNFDYFWAANGIAPFYLPCSVILTVYDFVYKVEAKTMSFKSRVFRGVSQPYWIKRANIVFTISNAINDELNQYFGKNADAVIRPAIAEKFKPSSIDEIRHAKNKYTLPEQYNLIVGTLEPRKNLVLFIKTYIDFVLQYQDIKLPKLVISGAKGWRDTEIINLLTIAEKMDLVQRLGYVDENDLPHLYSAASLFFMPSRYEGFGMPALEARMCGTPVVCSDVPALHEAAGESALFHQPTYSGIFEALEKIYIENKAPIVDNIQIDWSWDSGADQLMKVIQSQNR